MIQGAIVIPAHPEILHCFGEYASQFPIEVCREQWQMVTGSCRSWMAGDDAGMHANTALRDAIEAKKPYSLVRIGDGEGAILFSRWGRFPRLARICARKTSQRDYGDSTVVEGHAEYFELVLRNAILDADVLGISGLQRLEATFAKDTTKMSVEMIRGVCGVRGTFHYLADRVDLQNLANTLAATAHVHHGLLPYYLELLRDQAYVGLISRHASLADRLEAQTGARIQWITVPAAADEQGGAANDHFPDAYNRVIDEICPPYRGAVYLVAAGVLSKGYCSVIKRRGGIAIDIGSVADIWVGSRTRPVVAPAMIERWRLA